MKTFFSALFRSPNDFYEMSSLLNLRQSNDAPFSEQNARCATGDVDAELDVGLNESAPFATAAKKVAVSDSVPN